MNSKYDSTKKPSYPWWHSQTQGGGKVVVGVDNNGHATGIKAGHETVQRYFNEVKVATYPQILPNIDEYEIENKKVLIFEISEYPVKPISYKNRYYKRIKNSNNTLSLDEIVDLQQQSLNIAYDAYPLNENLPENLPETQQDIIKNMLKNSKVTYDELAGITGKTRETVRVHINKLKEMGIIKRFGPDKGGYWHVTLQENKKKTDLFI